MIINCINISQNATNQQSFLWIGTDDEDDVAVIRVVLRK